MAVLLPSESTLLHDTTREVALLSTRAKERVMNLSLLDMILSAFQTVHTHDHHVLLKLLAILVSHSLQECPSHPYTCGSSSDNSIGVDIDKEAFICQEVVTTICSFEVNGVLLQAAKRAVLHYCTGATGTSIAHDALKFCSPQVDDVASPHVSDVDSHTVALDAVTDILHSLEYLILSRLSPTVALTPTRCQRYIRPPLMQWARQLLQQQIHRCVVAHHPVDPRAHSSLSLFPLHVVRDTVTRDGELFLMHSRDLTEVVQVLIDLLPRLLTSLELGSGTGGESAILFCKQVGIYFIRRGLDFLTLLLAVKAKV